MLSILFFWLVLAIIVGVAAGSRGRNGLGWFLLAMVLSPLLAGLLVLALPKTKSQYELHVERTMMRTCPQCAESIKREAVICRFCHQAVEPLPFEYPRISPARSLIVATVVLTICGFLVWKAIEESPKIEAAASREPPGSVYATSRPPMAQSAPETVPLPRPAPKDVRPHPPLRLTP
jgi:hypothetical protein